MKNIILFLILSFSTGVAMSEQNNNETHIPNKDLINFILQTIWDSVPSPWYTAKMEVTVEKTGDGKNLIDAKYSYKANKLSSYETFSVSNVFGPLNAAKRLQNQMAAEGSVWSSATISINSDGSYEVNVE